MFDVCIIGGGPAGLAAATWLGRFRKSVVVIDSGQYRNRWSDRMHGYLGSDPVAPPDLLAAARKDLEQYEDISIVPDRISEVTPSAEGFFSKGEISGYASRRLILATGVKDSFPKIENFEEHYGAGMFHCPLCDGYEARGKHAAVLGYSEESAAFAAGLLNWAASVTLLAQEQAGADQEGFRKASREPAVEIIWSRPVRLEGQRGDLRAITLDSGKSIPCEVAFFSTGNHPRSELAEQLGCAFTEEDCVQVDQDAATTVPGVFAAGDLTPGPHLVQVAAAKGAVAGSSCARSLMQ